MTRPRSGLQQDAPPVTLAERLTWATQRLHDAIDRMGLDGGHDPALVLAVVARLREVRDIQDFIDARAVGQAIAAGRIKRRVA